MNLVAHESAIERVKWNETKFQPDRANVWKEIANKDGKWKEEQKKSKNIKIDKGNFD